ncbi:MAG: DoxX family protein [Planctomycetaceae bacterium]|nr:DoxX family protein [Planctomycetaceae bacterium]
METRTRTLSWILQVVAAAILGQTLFFKFTGAPEAVWIFTTLGVEPYGRISTGVMELVAVVALLVPRTAALGAALSLGLMVGAIGSHLFVLGIEVQGDGGTLFVLALVTAAASAVVLWLRRAELPVVGPLLAARQSR